MSTFRVPVVRIQEITPIPGADQIELARVFGYQSVVRRGDFQPGDLAAYIPEAAVLPNWLIDHLGLTGKLAGSSHNRVKAVKLRGCVSQGILLKLAATGPGGVSVPFVSPAGALEYRTVSQSDDLADLLGITKYEPPIPVHLQGEVANLFGHTRSYDIENIQRYPDVLVESEPVVMLEKIHGSCTALAHWPGLRHPELLDTEFYAYSKGLGAQGLVFRNSPANLNNIYHKCLLDHQEKLLELRNRLDTSAPIFLFGETHGPGIQDLNYGLKKPEFRVFDCWVGDPNQGKFLNWKDLVQAVQGLFVPVPVLYQGAWCSAELARYRDGLDSITGGHVREGVVIKPLKERTSTQLGRVILKAVSPAYLFRQGNTTEHQ